MKLDDLIIAAYRAMVVSVGSDRGGFQMKTWVTRPTQVLLVVV